MSEAASVGFTLVPSETTLVSSVISITVVRGPSASTIVLLDAHSHWGWKAECREEEGERGVARVLRGFGA